MLSYRCLTRLCRARDRLRDIGPQELSLADIAREAAMSRFHFARRFKAVFGDSPGRYRTRERLSRARHLLASGEHSVTEVCMAVGFSSLGSFSTRFARRFGESPSAFQQRQCRTTDDLTPHCMTLLWQAWETDSQFSRSPDGPC